MLAFAGKCMVPGMETEDLGVSGLGLKSRGRMV